MKFFINSKQNPKIKFAASLKLNKVRSEHNLFLIEGIKPLKMALELNLVKEVFTIVELDLPSHINQYIVTKEIIEKLSYSVNPEGIIFISNIPNYEIKGNKLIYLDNIQDPGNMGTIIRTALSLGYDGLIYSKGSVSPYNEKVIASTKGAIFLLPIMEGELSSFKDDYQIVVSALHQNSISLDEFKSEDKFVLVLGNEAHGVSSKTLSLADAVVEIPLKNMESLNVAVAGAILMYELNKNS